MLKLQLQGITYVNFVKIYIVNIMFCYKTFIVPL